MMMWLLSRKESECFAAGAIGKDEKHGRGAQTNLRRRLEYDSSLRKPSSCSDGRARHRDRDHITSHRIASHHTPAAASEVTLCRRVLWIAVYGWHKGKHFLFTMWLDHATLAQAQPQSERASERRCDCPAVWLLVVVWKLRIRRMTHAHVTFHYSQYFPKKQKQNMLLYVEQTDRHDDRKWYQ